MCGLPEGKEKYRRKSSVSPSPLPPLPAGPPLAAKVDMLERSVDSLKGGMQQILTLLSASFPANSEVGDDHGDRPTTTENIDFFPGRMTVEGEKRHEDRRPIEIAVVSSDLPMGQQTVSQAGGQSALCASTPLRDEPPTDVPASDPFLLPMGVPVSLLVLVYFPLRGCFLNDC